MKFVEKKVEIKVGGKVLELSTGKIGKQANGCVVAKYEGVQVIATVCCGQEPSEPLDYVPLSVEYNERYYAAGKIPGGFLKREGKPKDKEILVSRIVDRPMRPLFDKAFGREIQIVPTVVSADQINPPDMVAAVASSAAVTISDIPFDGPVATVRVAYIDGKYIINPTFSQIEACQMDIVVAGTKDGITMVEGGAKEVSEEVMLGAILEAEKVIKEICKAEIELKKQVGKNKLSVMKVPEAPSWLSDMEKSFMEKVRKAAFANGGKLVRSEEMEKVTKEALEKYKDKVEEDSKNAELIKEKIGEIQTNLLRTSILEKDLRVDGRNTKEVRPIVCETGLLVMPHGSALFTRGETQSLATTTLGSQDDEQLVDDIDSEKRTQRFILHYNFPPYSVGECGKLTTGRREIGHGHLAQRALESVLPSKKDYPYTIRVVSDIMESNGSSSMATVCGGCLSLLDAGVPIKDSVAGIAMGLITSDEKYTKYKILTDILGEEDHMGDMDFKVAGTKNGITAFQMDIKIAGVTPTLMREALDRAKIGRLHILSIMNATLDHPNTDKKSSTAPQILKMKIKEEKIGSVIGTGGKTIKQISSDSGAQVTIDDNGGITIFGSTKAKAEKAQAMIKALVEEPEVGKTYEGTVKRIMDFGAFIEILPKVEGLCHISKLSKKRVEKVDDVLSVGQVIPVKLVEIDRMGRLNLSYIDALNDADKN